MTAAVLAIGEVAEGRPTRLTLELATLAVRSAGDLGGTARVLLVGADVAGAAAEVAAHGPDVLVAPGATSTLPFAAAAVSAALDTIERLEPVAVLVGASPDGKDLAGMLVGLTDLPVLVAANRVEAVAGALEVEKETWGGRLVTRSAFSGGRGIVIVRPGAVSPEVATTPGTITALSGEPREVVPEVRLLERVVAAAGRASIDDARIIVAGGRGLGGPDGFRLLEDLAAELDGAVGATRAAVDAGWIDFGQQIGQTGKTVKPDLYIACGISGAIQHKVGVQSAGTIVAINRDPDAPIAGFADMLVVGDLFEIVPRLTEAVRVARERRAP